MKRVSRINKTVYLVGSVAGLLLAFGSMEPALASGNPPGKSAQIGSVKSATSAKLFYGFEQGKVYHYKVIAVFSGQIPKLSEPGTDVHIKAELYYSATVTKKDGKGTTIAFAVDTETLSFLAKEPGADMKINPDDELPFPLPLAQVQGFLNVTAVLRPDGSIAEVSGGNNNPIKIDVGVDLRKLFVLMLPVVFADRAVATGTTWNFDEGFLGKKAGHTTYTAKLDDVKYDAVKSLFKVSQVAKSTVLDKIDKEGNSTPDPKLQVGSIIGEVSATGIMNFGASKLPAAVGSNTSAAYAGRLVSGNMSLSVALKRTMPDPEHPEKTITDPITVRGRMSVTQQAAGLKLEGVSPATTKTK